MSAPLYLAVSACLCYPDGRLLGQVPLMRRLAAEGDDDGGAAARDAPTARPTLRERLLGPPPGEGGARPGWPEGAGAAVVRFLDHAEATPLRSLQTAYVETFDFTRRHALHLSYWTDGDTRRRGEVLAGFKRAYRQSGLYVTPDGELPDYLPMVLEYAAHDPGPGRDLLIGYRPGLELLRIALEEGGSPYAPLVAAVCATLPGPSPRDRQAVMALAGHGPPTESVGLDPYDARLLPLADTTRGT